VKREFLVERTGRTFALYAGLLDKAHGRGLKGITTELVQVPSEANGQTAICRATVTTESGTFTGLGDACPSSVSRTMVPHLIRLAETRAKARALRDAVNVGVTALEELGPEGPSEEATDARSRPADATADLAPSTKAAPAGRMSVLEPDGRATAPQYRLLRELAGRLAGRVVPDGLTRIQASELIDRWQAERLRP